MKNDRILVVFENILVICRLIGHEIPNTLGGNCKSYTIFTAEKIRLSMAA